MLPLRLTRVIIEENGTEFDSRKGFKKKSHENIYAFVHLKYKAYIDEIADSGGYILVKTDSNSNPVSFEAKEVPLDLKKKLNQ